MECKIYLFYVLEGHTLMTVKRMTTAVVITSIKVTDKHTHNNTTPTTSEGNTKSEKHLTSSVRTTTFMPQAEQIMT